MKSIHKLILFTFVALAVVACDDFLERTPYEYVSVEGFYKNAKEIEQAVTGCYNSLIKIHRTQEYIFNETRSDNATMAHTNNISVSADRLLPSLLVVDISNSYVSNYWAASYDLIARCNLVLSKLDVVENVEQHAQFEAETKFLRSWGYFNLVRYFGGVPLIIKPVTTGDEVKSAGRSEPSAVYQHIIETLKDAVELFTQIEGSYTPVYGRANKWAAEALLANVYLTVHQPGDALPLLQDIYDNGPYKLTADFADLFTVASEVGAASQEILFPIRFQSGGFGLGNNFSGLMAHMEVSDFGSNLIFYSDDLFNAFVNTSDTLTDVRYPVTCGRVDGQFVPADPTMKDRYSPKMVGLVSDGQGGHKAGKLINVNDGDLDWPEIRFADVVLMLAEIKGIDGGLALLNEVRERAHAPLYTADDIQNLFAGDFTEAVLNERRLELAMENKRLFDLLRMGDAYATETLYKKYTTEPAYRDIYPDVHTLVSEVTAGGKVDAWRLLLPIPLNQILRSDALTQNPGYAQ